MNSNPDTELQRNPILTTPKKITDRYPYNRIIHELNEKWNLGLPKFQSPDSTFVSEDASPSEKETAKTCAEHIRSLYFRSNSNLANLLEQYDEGARQRFSGWTWKLSQERGTLPVLPKIKSALRIDAMSKSKLASPSSRQELLDRLEIVLQAEFRDTEAREASRRASNIFSDPVSPSPSRLRRSARHELQTPTPVPTSRETSKRSRPQLKDEGIVDLPRKVRRLGNLDGWLHNEPSLGTDPRLTSGLDVSFESAASREPAPIFTPPEGEELASAITSFSAAESSDDLFPSQLAREIEEDEDFRKSFQECDKPFHESPSVLTASFLNELHYSGPFKTSQGILPEDLSFRFRYELDRVSEATGIPFVECYKRIASISKTKDPNYSQLWQAVQEIRSKTPGTGVLEESSAKAWDYAQGNFQGESGLKSVYLSGNLDWKEPRDPGLFRFRLNPLKMETSCRFHRKFGSHRFMVVSMPIISKRSLPKDVRDLQKHHQNIHDDVASWLANSFHNITGRKWRAFYTESEKSKRKGGLRTQKLHLFAISGPDLAPISVNEFLNWHIPVQDNLNSSDLKAFSRFGLGLSKTIRTVVLEPSEFIHLHDHDPVMNDGCASMSLPLATEIAKMLGITPTPSAFQARIGGAKGLWVVDFRDVLHTQQTRSAFSQRGFWIEISDSQLKIKPHPAGRKGIDIEQRVFEVLDFSKPPSPASLNVQLLNVLHDRGIRRETFRKLLIADTNEYYTSLSEAANDPLSLRCWLQSNMPKTRKMESMEFPGAFPDGKVEQLNHLAECEFHPGSCPIMFDGIVNILRDYLTRYVEKLQISVPLSIYVYCIADPYGVLEENEVYLGLSKPRGNPITGALEAHLHDVDVLVARLPAALPSDVQRRRAVFRQELRDYHDVVIFSSKGQTPLASLLSGGDYDGDKPWVCWDPEIVSRFKNIDVPCLPSPEDCGLVQSSKLMAETFPEENRTTQHVDDFFSKCFNFNLHPSLVGECTNEHERLIYRDGSLSTPGAIKLAALAGHLVDSVKQGHLMTDDAWKRLRLEVVGKSLLPVPAYKNLAESCKPNENNIVDYLKFNVAESEKERILKGFQEQWADRGEYDKTLSEKWNTTLTRAENEAKQGDTRLKQILDDLKRRTRSIVDKWKIGVAKREKSSEADGLWFKPLVRECHGMMQAIEPLPMTAGEPHDIHRLFEQERGQAFSFWNWLRASCMYYHNPRGAAPWYVAGDVLCFIKSQSMGPTRTMTSKVYSGFKVDKKLVKRWANRVADETEELDDPEDPQMDDELDTLRNWILE